MARPAGLTKRRDSNNWYFRMRCPAHLRATSPRAEAWVSLLTADYVTALKKIEAARTVALRSFRRAPSGIAPSTVRARRPDDLGLPLLCVEDAAPLAVTFFRQQLRELEASPPPQDEFDQGRLLDHRQELEHRMAVLASPDLEEEHPTLSYETLLLQKHRLRAPAMGEPSRLLREYLRRALLQLVAIEKARLEGDFSVGVTDTLFGSDALPWRAPAAAVPQRSGASVTVRLAADRYVAELLAKARRPKTQDRYRDEVAHLVSFFGPERPVSEIRRQDCVDFRDAFAVLPPNFARKLRAGETLRDLVARRRADDPVLAYATLEKYLSALTRFIEWAFQEDYLQKNYAKGVQPLGSKPDGSVAKLPFDDDELRRIFSRPIYTGCRDDEYGFAKPGPRIVRRSRYWAPLISLFAGLRAGEILQLTPSHFRRSDAGTDFIVLTPDMRLKGENAQREIPVHPVLRCIGLLGWVERRCTRDPLARLFPEVAPDKYEAESPIFSKRFRSDLKHFELGDRREKLTFHSFRHTFKRALDRADVSEQHKDELCGWARGKKTVRRYGSGLEADVLRPYLEWSALEKLVQF